MPLTDAQIERYSRQIIVPGVGGRGQERLLAARILLAGAVSDLEQPLAYLVGAGVGSIGFCRTGEGRAAWNFHEEMYAQNPDVAIRAITDRELESPARFDLAMFLVSDDASRDLAATRVNRIDADAFIVARLDHPPRIAILTGASRCPRCADASLLSGPAAPAAYASAPASPSVRSAAPAAAVVAMIATTEALKLLSGFIESPPSVIVDFDGYATRSRGVTSTCTCISDRTTPILSF